MKRLIAVGFCCVVCGCSSLPVAPSVSQESTERQFIVSSQLHVGLSRDEVSGLLGKEVVTGYALADEITEQYKPITVPNPQRSEMIKKNGKIYMVDYYLAGIKVADDKISDDELLPVVFESDRLVGSGWDFFNKHFKGL